MSEGVGGSDGRAPFGGSGPFLRKYDSSLLLETIRTVRETMVYDLHQVKSFDDFFYSTVFVLKEMEDLHPRRLLDYLRHHLLGELNACAYR